MSGITVDIAVIGAGVTGLTCASELQKAGYAVTVLEKSRGLGGRVATRRIQDTCFDYGLPSLVAQGALTQQWIDQGRQQALLKPWPWPTYVRRDDGTLDRGSEARPVDQYIAPAGMTAIAKDLANGLDVRRQHRVGNLSPQAGHWQVQMVPLGESAPDPISARAIALTVPAPQAADLLRPLTSSGLPVKLIQEIESVEFEPCLTAIAGYSFPEEPAEPLPDPWGAIRFEPGAPLRWLGIDSSKRLDAGESSLAPIVVYHSSPEFARQHLEAPDLDSVGRHLLDWAGAQLIPWLASPEWLQVHRWRYAFCCRPLNGRSLHTIQPLPLVCGGDWCGGHTIESAIQSGLAMAKRMNSLLNR
ncbi:MAG: FAD-dependent oxidoreductase [Synechococcales bacterium]|nr:FAD-dependent oxidoreductase [Synechococcales bacterium]